MSQHSLSVKLQNCYGIGSLEADFNFEQKKTTIVYAPNGAMKTSFARTFIDIADGKETSDRIFPERGSVRDVNFRGANGIDPNAIVVIEPFNSSYQSKSLGKLLVNERLKREYDSIHDAVGSRLADLIENLSKSSGIKKGDVASVLVSDTTISKTDIYTALARLERQVAEIDEPLFSVKYSDVLNPKIIALVENDDVRVKIKEYSEKYDDLLSKSRFFRAGKFNHYNASTVSKILKENGWFAGGHSVTLKNGAAFTEISSEKDLEALIQEEMDSILNDALLKKTFLDLDKLLNKNAELREYREFLSKNNSLIAELADIPAFKERLWISYLCEAKSNYVSLIKEYDAARRDLDRIRSIARDEVSQWDDVISIFNERFSVPFRVYIDNQEDVILQSVAPTLGFSYFDTVNQSEKKVSAEILDESLSQGGRRAKYLLNVIFEMEGRKSDDHAIFVIDDIADSFDYKNKYAIIEYLRDISDHSSFYQLILTHNYDFFRTVVSRLELHQPNRLYASKNGGEIKINPTPKEQNPFVQWKKNLNEDVNVLACVPFIRNIAEYCGHADCFDGLTTALHWKSATPDLTLGDISDLFAEVITDGSASIGDREKKYIRVLFDTCDDLADQQIEDFSLEKKIALAIGTRLFAEKYMVESIADQNWVDGLKTNQTGKLSRRFSEMFAGDASKLNAWKLIRRVNLITPENVHVNSFMYEPILDISPVALRDLYLSAKQVFV